MGPVQDSDLLSELGMFGVDNVSKECMDKIRELCLAYGHDAARFTCDWVAFASRRGIDAADLTVSALEELEREELSKQQAKPVVKTPVSKKPPPKIFSAREEKTPLSGGYCDVDDQLLESYGVDGELLKKRQRTPDNRAAKRPTDASGSPSVVFSPASFSPNTLTVTERYASRTTSGEVVTALRRHPTPKWEEPRDPKSETDVRLLWPGSAASKKPTYMFERAFDRAAALNDAAVDFADLYEADLPAGERYAHVGSVFQEPSYVTGRIYSDGAGKVTSGSLVLEGSDSSSGASVPLDVSGLRQYSFFSGQVIVGKGINPTGKRLVLQELAEGKMFPFPRAAPRLKEPLHLVIACGPYTTSDTLHFRPLSDLTDYLVRHRPHVCIMAGPFVDSKHELIRKGSLPQTFDSIFQEQMRTLASVVEKTRTKVVLIPSQRDVHHDFVYPTPPFRLEKNYENITCAPDPCTLDVEGFLIGATSVDVLLHLGKEEISTPARASDRLSRLAKHVLTQHCFYPLHPPSEDVNLDCGLLERDGRFTLTPHLLVLPSDLRCFVKDVEGCVCVNPERITKGVVGGTFARVLVTPCESYRGSMTDNIGAEIIKI